MDGLSWKTLLKWDHLGVPLFLETSILKRFNRTLPSCFSFLPRNDPFKNRFANDEAQEFQKRLHIFLRQADTKENKEQVNRRGAAKTLMTVSGLFWLVFIGFPFIKMKLYINIFIYIYMKLVDYLSPKTRACPACPLQNSLRESSSPKKIKKVEEPGSGGPGAVVAVDL